MTILQRLLMEDIPFWDQLMIDYEKEIKKLKVPTENSSTTLHIFNVALDEVFTKIEFDLSRARRNKEAIEQFLDSVLKDYYKGQNEAHRKAGGIQYARNYPAPDFWEFETINLYDMTDQFRYYFYTLQAAMKALEHKASAKITSNSILNIERSLIPG